MSGDESDEGVSDDELEVTDLRPAGARNASTRRRARFIRGRRMWRWAPLALNVSLLAAVTLSVLPEGSAWLRALKTPARPVSVFTPTGAPSSGAINSYLSTPTSDLTARPAPALALAPASCGSGAAPALTHVGPPHWGAAVGHAPVWVAGFTDSYPTLRLGTAASANAYGWDAPYTRYGWPAPIGLALQPDFRGQLSLSGYNTQDGQRVWFGFIEAGVWGAPTRLAQTFQLDPVNPLVPAGGSDSTSVFWYGYVFFPRAGCYVLVASWPGGNWTATVSAGR